MDQQIHLDDGERTHHLLEELRKEGVFASESIRRGAVQELNIKRAGRWSKIGKCHFPQCPDDAIERSHSLSDKAMIDPIAENRHVMGPKVNTFEGKYEVVLVPVNKASVFPGFCEHHEGRFGFEKTGHLSDGKELQMQLFRSICRQVFFLTYEHDNLLEYRETMRIALEERIDGLLQSGSDWKSSPAVIHNHVNAEVLGLIHLMIEQREKDIAFTLEHWYEPNAQCFGNGLPKSMYDELIKIPNMQPIVMSGPITMDDIPRDPADGTPDFSRVMFLNLFPNDNYTLLHIVSLQEHGEELRQLATKLEADGNYLTSMIQYWMVASCEHWYMSPSFWEGLDAAARSKILDSLNPSG